MPQIKPDFKVGAKIKVVGVGGSGCNAIDHMIHSKVKGVDFIALNTDSQDLHTSFAPVKIQIGKELTKGLGAGMNPEIGRAAAEESKQEILETLKGADMVFITCGMGGGTGSSASTVVVELAKQNGILTVAVVTRPFHFEGEQRMRIAEEWIARLKEVVDAYIVIPNERLLSIVDKETTFLNAFAVCDEILRQAVQGISDVITTPGIVNIDFADVRTVLKNSGHGLIGIGIAQGEKRAETAATMAINSPLLEVSINGAKGVLFAIAGGPDITMWEIQEAARIITESVDRQAKVIFGAFHDENLKKSEIKITVVAAGFPQKDQNFNMALELGEKGGQKPVGGYKIPVSRPPAEKKETDEWESVPAFLRRSKNL